MLCGISIVSPIVFVLSDSGYVLYFSEANIYSLQVNLRSDTKHLTS